MASTSQRTGPGPLGATDPTRWRLDSSDAGRHCWSYEGGSTVPLASEPVHRPQSTEEKHWLGLPAGIPDLEDPAGDPLKAARNGYRFWQELQAPDGHWSGEYGGPEFLMGGFVIAGTIAQAEWPEEWRIEICRNLANSQRTNGEADSGWGIHIESPSTVFGTVLNYVALRLLGVEPDVPMMVRARATLHKLVPSWGKMWLSVMNLYSWDGFNCVPAELWLLPEFLPIHPSRWWIHTRAVYIPMSWLYGRRFQTPVTPLITAIRAELYAEPYESIDWASCRNKCAPGDLFAPHPPVLDALFALLNTYERWVAPAWLRKRGMARAYELMRMDDEHTDCQALAPVSSPLHLVCRAVVEGPDSPAVKRHVLKVRDFMWMGPEGMRASGTNGSQLWDLAFTAQALVEAGLAIEPDFREGALKGLRWLDECQIRDNPKHMARSYRHPTKGAWPFSTREQGYTVSDCTSEALKAVIWLQELDDFPRLVSDGRMRDAVDIILSLQNPSGGFSSYEPIRGHLWLEKLNPAEVFGGIMTEYAYPECTSACVTALAEFARRQPAYRAAEIAHARAEGIRYLHASQKPEGGWLGSWAICFTYSTMFVLGALASVGETYETSARVRRACAFLLEKQMADGGWGESYLSCVTGSYVPHAQSQVVNTAFAVIALLNAKCPERAAIKRGCQLLMSRQQRDGSWKQEAIEGIFNNNCAIAYPSYKHTFSIMALGRAARELKGEKW